MHLQVKLIRNRFIFMLFRTQLFYTHSLFCVINARITLALIRIG